jgi:hypothetical protein
LPADALRALRDATPVAAHEGEIRLVMLWGPPGSGSERLAAALRYAASRPLMLATADLLPRTLEFSDGLIMNALNPDVLPAMAAEVAVEYARSIEPYLRQGNQGVFDWLARWDARVVHLQRHALPGTRLLAVLRDPRDLLLNWLAFGAPAGPVFADPVASADWLAAQLEHLLFARDELRLPVLILDMDRFDENAEAAMAEIAAFAGLPGAPDPQVALSRRTGPGRLPMLLPAGRWRAYRDELGAAFERLEPLAQQLGYPSE